MIQWAKGETLRLRAALDESLGHLKADVRASQAALASRLQAELKQIETEKSKRLTQVDQELRAKVEQLDRQELVRKTKGADLVKRSGLLLRDSAALLEKHQSNRPTSATSEADLLPATEVREILSLGTVVFRRASTLDRDLPAVPALVPFVDQGHLIIEATSGTSDAPAPAFKALMTSLVAQTFAAAPPGQMVVTVFNPRSSKVLAGYRPTGAEEAGLLKILQPTKEAFEKSLEEQLTFSQRVESSIGTYGSLGDLVRQTGQHEHQYHALVIIDGPSDWTSKSVDLLEKLMASGGKAGLSILIHRDPQVASPDRIDLGRLYKHASILKEGSDGFTLTVHGVAKDPVPVKLIDAVAEDAQGALMRAVVKGAKTGSLPNIPFADLVVRSSETSDRGVQISMGRKGTQVTGFKLGDTDSNIQNLLVGGKVGSGKTNLLKVIIYSMAARYPRDELELFLLDFKEGGDFMPFTGGEGRHPLPNATVVSRDCDPGFGLAVLRHFKSELDRRSSLTSENHLSNIWDLREQKSIVLPRWILVIDEFQGLFAGPTNLEATELLEHLTRIGRSFGLHVILATQTLSGVRFAGAEKDKAILENVGGRVVLQLGPGEFTKFMQTGNDESGELRYRGQAIFNPMGGRQGENQLFVVAHADAAATATLQDELYREQAQRSTKLLGPLVYRGSEKVTASELLVKNGRPTQVDGNLPAWFGKQSTIDAHVAVTMLSPMPGSHVLVLGGDEKVMPTAIATVQTAVLSAVAAAEEPIEVLIFDDLIQQFRTGALIDEWLETLVRLGAKVVRFNGEATAGLLDSIDDAMRHKRRALVVLLGTESSDFARVVDEGNRWRNLLREMPRRGVNVIGLWTDLRDIPGDKHALKDDYKTMLVLGKNEHLAVEATKRGRHDLPPLHESRALVFSSASSQQGFQSVASIARLTEGDLEAFQGIARRAPGALVIGGVVAQVERAQVQTPKEAAASPVAAIPASPPIATSAALNPVAQGSSASGVTAIVGLGQSGPVAVRLGGPEGVQHVLIAGRPLTGLPTLTLALIDSAADHHDRTELQIDLLDSMEDSDFLSLTSESLPQFGVVATGARASDVESTLRSYGREVRRRQMLFESAGTATFVDYRATGASLPRRVLVWNEYTEVLTEGIAQQIEWLAGVGSSVGIHLVLTALTPIQANADLAFLSDSVGRLVTRLAPDESLALIGTTAAGELERRSQALFMASPGGNSEVFSIPENDENGLGVLRKLLGGVL